MGRGGRGKSEEPSLWSNEALAEEHWRNAKHHLFGLAESVSGHGIARGVKMQVEGLLNILEGIGPAKWKRR